MSSQHLQSLGLFEPLANDPGVKALCDVHVGLLEELSDQHCGRCPVLGHLILGESGFAQIE